MKRSRMILSSWRQWFLVGIAVVMSGCLQLETPHTFREEEETKMRAKNVHQYYKGLEEQIQREKHLIKLLQDTLNLHITSEQTLSQEVEKRGKDVERKRGDLTKLNQENLKIDQEIGDLEKQIKKKRKKLQELQAALTALGRQVGELEKQQAEGTPVDKPEAEVKPEAGAQPEAPGETTPETTNAPPLEAAAQPAEADTEIIPPPPAPGPGVGGGAAEPPKPEAAKPSKPDK